MTPPEYRALDEQKAAEVRATGNMHAVREGISSARMAAASRC